jgi:hypothetical protein
VKYASPIVNRVLLPAFCGAVGHLSVKDMERVGDGLFSCLIAWSLIDGGGGYSLSLQI